MDAEVKSEAQRQGIDVGRMDTVKVELGTEVIVTGKGVGVTQAGIGRVHTAESATREFGAERAEERWALEIGILARNADVADFSAEMSPQRGTQGSV